MGISNVATKTKRTRVPGRGKGKARYQGGTATHIATTIKKQLDANEKKIWRYISINQKNAIEHSCTGEISELYKAIASNFPDQPIRPWWTEFNNDTVLLCYHLPEYRDHLAHKQLFVNRYICAWFPEASKWNLDIKGRVLIVPMNQTKFDVFKIKVKQMVKANKSEGKKEFAK